MKKFKSEYHLAVQKEIEIPIEDILSFEILRKRLVVLLETGFLCQDSFQKAISFALLEILAKDSFSFSFFDSLFVRWIARRKILWERISPEIRDLRQIVPSFLLVIKSILLERDFQFNWVRICEKMMLI